MADGSVTIGVVLDTAAFSASVLAADIASEFGNLLISQTFRIHFPCARNEVVRFVDQEDVGALAVKKAP